MDGLRVVLGSRFSSFSVVKQFKKVPRTSELIDFYLCCTMIAKQEGQTIVSIRLRNLIITLPC
jgi:hypothetical protein